MENYKAMYTEIKTLGRGNFGVADLVRHKIENKKYVAKKILVGNCS
jgi:hypothetical protein